MTTTIIPTALGYCAGEVVSLIKPFKEHKPRTAIGLGTSDESSLDNAKVFLQDALAGGPYNELSQEFNLMPGEEKRANNARIGFQILVQMVPRPIDLGLLKSKLSSYIRMIGKMEQWEFPTEDEQSTLDEVDKFFRHLIAYANAESYKAAFGNENVHPF